MMPTEIPPFIIFYAAALLTAVSRGYLRALILLLAPVLAAAVLLNIEVGENAQSLLQTQLFDYRLSLFRVDKLSLLFGYLFVLVGFVGNLYALHIKDYVQPVTSLIYVGSALGAVFAGDLLSLFLFWEMLAISSVFLIWSRRSANSFATGLRYLITQVLSGVLLLSGALMLAAETGDLAFTAMSLDGLSAWLIFLGFGIKCAFPLVHYWIPDAYPEATPTGTVFLSAFSTKVAVYALARSFSGTDILIDIGAVMIVFPIIYALLENDLRRLLAYLMITQIGIMVIGIGIGTPLALNGTSAHVVIHVIYKSILFMAMGTVLFGTGRIKINELGGLAKTLPLTAGCCIFAVAFLFIGGFIGKALIMQAAIETGHNHLWLLLLASATGVFFASLRVPYYAFFHRQAELQPQQPPVNMSLAMLLAATVCLLLALFPQNFYSWLPYPLDYWPYDFSHILTHTELYCFAILAFIVSLKFGWQPPTETSINLDIDWLFRKPLKQACIGSARLTTKLYAVAIETIDHMWAEPQHILKRLFATNGIFERMPASGIAISVILALFVFMLLGVLTIG